MFRDDKANEMARLEDELAAATKRAHAASRDGRYEEREFWVARMEKVRVEIKTLTEMA